MFEMALNDGRRFVKLEKCNHFFKAVFQWFSLLCLCMGKWASKDLQLWLWPLCLCQEFASTQGVFIEWEEKWQPTPSTGHLCNRKDYRHWRWKDQAINWRVSGQKITNCLITEVNCYIKIAKFTGSTFSNVNICWLLSSVIVKCFFFHLALCGFTFWQQSEIFLRKASVTVRSTSVVDVEILLPQLWKYQQSLQPHTFTRSILPPQTGDDRHDEKKWAGVSNS